MDNAKIELLFLVAAKINCELWVMCLGQNILAVF